VRDVRPQPGGGETQNNGDAVRNAIAHPCHMFACIDCLYGTEAQRERGDVCYLVGKTTVREWWTLDASTAELQCPMFTPDAATLLDEARQEKRMEDRT